MKEKKELKYSNRYPDIKIGFGSYCCTEKFTMKCLISRRWWRDFRCEIRAAWKRAIRGYDGADVWNMDSSLTIRIIRLLLSLAEMTNSIPDISGNSDSNNVAINIAVNDEDQERLDAENHEWKELLAGIASHLYESIGIHCKEKNEFEEEYRNSYTLTESKKDEIGGFSFKRIPIDGYTEKIIDELSDKHWEREKEIEAYRKSEFLIGMNKLIEVYDHLWD